LYAGGVIRVGTFRCAADHPRFQDSGPISDFNVVFPRGAWYIQHEGEAAFLASPLVSPVYNDGQRYVRRPLTAGNGSGARSDWIALASPAEVADLVAAFDPAVVERPRRPLPFSCAPAPRRTYWRQRWLVDRLLAAPPIDGLQVEEEAFAIFADVVRAGFEDLPTTRPRRVPHADREIYEAACAVLVRRFREPLLLADLSSELSVSVSRLCQVFRGRGDSVHRTLVELRLRAALEPVLDGDGDLTGVALDLGFSSHSHFTAAFRRAFRMTPSQARRLRQRGWRATLGGSFQAARGSRR
jgi:AraC-like DNA-binding protein